MLPSFFIAHGAPLLAIEDNAYTKYLTQLGQSLPRPKAAVIFSAHWISMIQQVSEVDQYETIHDFGGFPEILYQQKYPARGNNQVAKEMEELFTQNDIPFEVENERGLDHGAWVVLSMLYPDADIPVISMSVNPFLTPEEQYKIGRALTALREKDVLVIGSGGTVHNLRGVKWENNYGPDDQWALDFDQWLEQQLKNWDLDTLFNYATLAPSANLAVPPYGREHFVPIFYAMGAANDQKQATLLHRSYRYGNLSHSIWQFG